MAQSASKKVLIVSNCNMHQLNLILGIWMPDCEIRGVLLPKAKKWLAEEHEGFLKYLKNLDYMIGITSGGIAKRANPDATLLRIPPIVFPGLHPDCTHDQTMEKTLELGHRYSNIALASYLAGMSADEACECFNREVYDRLGYISGYETAKQDFIADCKKRYDVDVGHMFKNWEKTGVYMYNVNHPKILMTFDIVSEFLIKHGIVSRGLLTAHREILSKDSKDPLSIMRQWPVYTEIAEAVGIKGGSYEWIRGAGRKGCKKMSLKEFLHVSYEVFDSSLSDLEGQKKEMEFYMDAVSESKAA